MRDPPLDNLIGRIDEYGTEAGFAKIVAEALDLATWRTELKDLKKEIAGRCKVAVSTVDRWARGASCPEVSVRRFVLDQIRDLLLNRP